MDNTNHTALITVNLKSVKELDNLLGDFDLYAQLKTNKKIVVTDWVRERFVIAGNTTQTIEFGEQDVVNFLYIEAQGRVMLDLYDASESGFGEGGFGEGGFGGVGAGLNGFNINGILCVEGGYERMEMTNNNEESIKIDLFAAKYEVSE